MFKIKYSLTQNSEIIEDIFSLNDFDFRYSLFNGNVIMCDEEKGINILMSWEWIPLFDFALSLRYIMSIFQNHNVKIEEFEFTESDSIIFFKKSGNIIEISTSFTKQKIVINDFFFYEGVMTFFNQLLQDIENAYPGIENNARYKRLIRQ